MQPLKRKVLIYIFRLNNNLVKNYQFKGGFGVVKLRPQIGQPQNIHPCPVMDYHDWAVELLGQWGRVSTIFWEILCHFQKKNVCTTNISKVTAHLDF